MNTVILDRVRTLVTALQSLRPGEPEPLSCAHQDGSTYGGFHGFEQHQIQHAAVPQLTEPRLREGFNSCGHHNPLNTNEFKGLLRQAIFRNTELNCLTDPPIHLVQGFRLGMATRQDAA